MPVVRFGERDVGADSVDALGDDVGGAVPAVDPAVDGDQLIGEGAAGLEEDLERIGCTS